jgi:hypothetical protein
MQRIADLLTKEKAQLWFNHDKAQRDRLKMAPTITNNPWRAIRALSAFGTKAKCRDVRFIAAIGGKAEVTRTSSNRRD